MFSRTFRLHRYIPSRASAPSGDVLVLLAGLALVALAAVASAGCGGPAREPVPAPGRETIAVFEPRAPLGRLLGPVDGRAFVPLAGRLAPRWHGQGVPDTSLGGVRFIEPLVRFETMVVPSDPEFEQQWALDAVRAARGWDLVPSARDLVVAVVDTGCAGRHPDLADSLWLNEGEIPDNGVDDDDNGYVDDLHGWDFVDDDPDIGPDPAGDDWHGTHVAGIVAAGWGNRRGIAGIAPGARLMCLRAMAGGTGRSDDIADAIDYAVDNGARLLNLSLGGSYSQMMDEAIDRARRTGVLVVAAAGNSGAEGVTYPASSTHANVVAVAASGLSGGLAEFSNRGEDVDVAAPGVDILSTYGARGYALLSGTSMATPHVTGALALALSRTGTASASALLSRLPNTRGTRRLDLPSLLAPGAAPPEPSLSLRRASLRFRVVGGHLPPPQTIAVDAPFPTHFEVYAPAWVKPGANRTAPGKLSLTLQRTALGSGAHRGQVRLRADGGSEVSLGIEVVIADRPPAPLAVEAVVDGDVFHPAGELRVSTESHVRLRLLAQGVPASAVWAVDGEPAGAAELAGAFVRPGSYKVVASRAGEGEVGLVVVAGGAGETPGVGVP